jgi:hypothetical protein
MDGFVSALIVEPLTLELVINNTGLGVIDYNLCATCSGIFYNDAPQNAYRG